MRVFKIEGYVLDPDDIYMMKRLFKTLSKLTLWLTYDKLMVLLRYLIGPITMINLNHRIIIVSVRTAGIMFRSKIQQKKYFQV